MIIPLGGALAELGELTLLIPLCALLCVGIAFRSRGAALCWTVAFVVCAMAIAALKLWFITCPQPAFGLRSPSGEAALATLFFPSLAWFAGAGHGRTLRAIVIAHGILAALAIGAIRVVLLANSIVETALGAAVGLAAFAFFVHINEVRGRQVTRQAVAGMPWLIMVLLLAITWALYGEHLPFEPAIRSVVAHPRTGLLVCP